MLAQFNEMNPAGKWLVCIMVLLVATAIWYYIVTNWSRMTVPATVTGSVSTALTLYESDDETRLTARDLYGADEKWSPKKVTEVIDPNDPHGWTRERFKKALQTPTAKWTMVDDENHDWKMAWRRCDDVLERQRRKIGDNIAKGNWGCDIRAMMRECDARDWTIVEHAQQAAMHAITDETEAIEIPYPEHVCNEFCLFCEPVGKGW